MVNKNKQTAITKKQTRAEIIQHLAEDNSMTIRQVESFFSSLLDLIQRHLKPRGSGEFLVPMTGIKLERVKQKKRPARTMHSPLLGEEVKLPAKAACNKVKARALKQLQEIVN